MEGCPFPTLVGIWYNPLRVNREPICYDEVNIPECNYNFGACCFRQIIRLLELLAVVHIEIEKIHRLFIVIAMYCQASPSMINKPPTLLPCWALFKNTCSRYTINNYRYIDYRYSYRWKLFFSYTGTAKKLYR